MNILVIDNGTTHSHELQSLLKCHNLKVIKYRKHTRVDLEWADLFVLSGGNRPALFRRYYGKEINLIKQSNKPIIGICIGMELIALANNGKMVRNSNKALGLRDITIQPEALGVDISTGYRVFEAHRWNVSHVEDFEVIGWSDRGLEIIKHPTKPIIGIQFHPEVTDPKNDGIQLLDACLQRLIAV